MSRISLGKLLASLSFFASTSLFAAPLVVDVSGIQSYDERGNAGNTVLTFNVGANAVITSVSYDVSLRSLVPSYLSEIGLAFSDAAGTIFGLVPGFGVDASGTGTFAGTVALPANFAVGSDGLLVLEFFEFFDDFANQADGIWDSGTVTFPTASASWGTVTHFAVWDASTSGNMLFHGALTASKTIDSGDTASFAATTLALTMA